MKRPSASLALVAVFAVVFLFFIQSAGTLVESIYIMDLMNTSMDEKALGLLFFFSPVLLVPFYKKIPARLALVCLRARLHNARPAPLAEDRAASVRGGRGHVGQEPH